jgi:acetolactate synthase-1/3 small subunit
MMFVKVKADGESQRAEVKRLSDIFRARIIDVTDTTFCIELTGAGDKLDAYIRAMHENNIVEVVRSGSMGIMRGERALTL